MTKLKEITKREFEVLYSNLTQTELAKALGVTQPAVAYYAKKFGLNKTRAKKVRFTK